MAKPNSIELGNGELIPILYEDRSVLAIDKPPDWMLVPFSWQRTDWNLQAALVSAIAAGFFWARSRNLKFLRYVHRLDAETSGILLLGKSPGAVETYGKLFESRQMEKTYLAAVTGSPKEKEWVCNLSLGADADRLGAHKVDPREGKPAETFFRVLETSTDRGSPVTSLVEARPTTGRTHQIRIHLAAAGHPVVGDKLYGAGSRTKDALTKRRRAAAATAELEPQLGLRAVALAYRDPFTRKRIEIAAPTEAFLAKFGFNAKMQICVAFGRGAGTLKKVDDAKRR